MKKALLSISVAASILSGCASVPMETSQTTELARQFNPPSEGQSGLYIYRGFGPGMGLKKDVWVDGKCIGETAPDIFFYEEVKGDQQHKISTESEFSPNDLILEAKSGQNYFIKQYIRPGVFVGGANLEIVSEAEGKKAITELQMAMKGNCSK